MVHAWQMMAMKFLAFNVDHWCAPPSENVNIDLWRNFSRPLKSDNTGDQCQYFDLDYSGSYTQFPTENTPTIECSK